MTKAIMIQGTGSNVGKSLIVAGIARALTKRGLRVAPFKPQNMSNNAATTVDGGEIGRAQALQARAAGLHPHSDMNPVLLKPETDIGAQVIVQGQRHGTMQAKDYGKHKETLMPRVLESFDRLGANVDLIIVEGAGSPAEINLRSGDIANMGFAEAAGIPVILVGDIDRGGVIAQLVGTQAILAPTDGERIVGFAINKFRGDPSLFAKGLSEIETRTNWPNLGVVPWFENAWRLPAEDAMDITSHEGGAIKIAVPKLSRIANFDDLDPLAAEPSVTIDIVEPGRALPGDADLVLIPGTKSTIGDLEFFKRQGWDVDLAAHIRRGGRVLGICGGYQLLGKTISDPEGIEGKKGSFEGLGHLNVDTVMIPKKRLASVAGKTIPAGLPVSGYEIHIGNTSGPDTQNAWLEIDGRPEGAASANGQILGCYLHGMFSSDSFRQAFLGGSTATDGIKYEDSVEQALDALAEHIEKHLNLDLLLSLSDRPTQNP